MTLRRLSFRIIALSAAYALALNVLLASVIVSAHAAADAPFAGAAACLNAPGEGQYPANDQDHDRASCVLHCLAVGAMDAWSPPPAGFLARLAPAEIGIARLVPAELPARPAPGNPQSPRAPPRA